jgi:hypothetical protein
MVLKIIANLNGGDLVTPDNELTYKIYGSADNYASPIATLGSAINDSKVSVANGIVTIDNVDVGAEGVFKISSVDAAGNEAILSDAVSTIKPFIIEVDTTKDGTSNDNQFTFTGALGDYNVVAKQNNIVVATFNDLSGEETITLPSTGVYVLEVTAKEVNGFNRIFFNFGGDKNKLTNLKQWGSIVWSSFDRAFPSCSNLLYTASDIPDLSNVTDMGGMFRFCGVANVNARNWDISNVTEMDLIFQFSNLSVENLTACYENWSQLNLQQNVSFGVGTTKYNASGASGRQKLIDDFNWTISDGGEI